eukprot:scaffold196648_cov19-Tisochrysis_lutea.AAC.2
MRTSNPTCGSGRVHSGGGSGRRAWGAPLELGSRVPSDLAHLPFQQQDNTTMAWQEAPGQICKGAASQGQPFERGS